MKVGYKGVYVSRTCNPDGKFIIQVHNFLNIIPSRTYPADTFLTWVSVVFESPIVIIGSSLIQTLVPTNRAPTVVYGGACTSDLVTLSLLTCYCTSLQKDIV